MHSFCLCSARSFLPDSQLQGQQRTLCGPSLSSTLLRGPSSIRPPSRPCFRLGRAPSPWSWRPWPRTPSPRAPSWSPCPSARTRCPDRGPCASETSGRAWKERNYEDEVQKRLTSNVPGWKFLSLRILYKRTIALRLTDHGRSTVWRARQGPSLPSRSHPGQYPMSALRR